MRNQMSCKSWFQDDAQGEWEERDDGKDMIRYEHGEEMAIGITRKTIDQAHKEIR